MKLLIAGGGTGGHIVPALAVADCFKDLDPNNDILFIGTERGLEAKLIPAGNHKISFINVRGIKKTGITNLLFACFEIPVSILISIIKIVRFKPDFVLGTGGYASGPGLLAALILRKKTAIMEQNSVPGITNKFLGKFTDMVFTADRNSLTYFPSKKQSSAETRFQKNS